MKKLFFLLSLSFILNTISAQNYVAAVLDKEFWGFIDEKGNYILQPMYNAARDFSSGIGLIKNLGDWYYVDKDGIIINSTSDYITRYDFSEKLARIEQNNLWGYINTSGEMVIQPQFTDANDFKNGYAAVRSGSLWGFINTKGNYIIEPQFKDAKNFENDAARVKSDKGWIFVNIQNKTFPSSPDQYEIRKDFSDGMAYILKDKLFGYINNKGEIVIQAQFQDVGNFNNGYAPVFIEKQWGYINKSGDYMVNPKFEVAKEFKDGMALVKDKTGYFYLNTAGQEIGKSAGYNVKYNFSDGYARIIQNGKWGFIDQSGKVVIDAQYEKAEDFSNGFAAVLSNGKWGYINKSGELIIDFKFRRAYSFIKL